MIPCIVIIDLHCDPTIPSGAGDLAGGNTYSRNLLMQLMKTSYKNIFITRKKYPYLDEYIKLSDNSDFYRIDLGDFGPIDKDELQKYHNISMQKIRKLLSEYSGFKFIFHSSYWQSGLIALELSKEFNTFYVHTILSNAKKKAILNAAADNVEGRIEAEETVFNAAKYLICSSISEMDDMQSLYHIDYSKLILTGLPIHNSYSNPAYLPSGSVSVNTMDNSYIKTQYFTYPQPDVSLANYSWWNEKSYIYMGRMHENKGIKQILQAWIQLAEDIGDNIPPLWIIGGAPAVIENFRNSLTPYLPLLEKYERRHKIIWWGALPPQGISTLLLKALVVVTHSKYEAGGLVAIEAMRQGIPVIGTPNGYVNDYVRNWYNGFVVGFNDINALSNRLRFFCNQPYLSEFLGANAKHTAIELEKTWGFFERHLFAYGLKALDNTQTYSVKNISCTYYNINHNPINIYPYLNSIPSDNKINDFMEDILKSDDFILSENKCKSNNYESWDILYADRKLKILYLYDIINEEEIWNPLQTSAHIMTKAQRVVNYITASKVGLCGSIIYSSTKDGLIVLDETKFSKEDLKTIITTFHRMELYPETDMPIRQYCLSDLCKELYSNISVFSLIDKTMEKIIADLQELIQQLPNSTQKACIGIAHGKHSANIFENDTLSLPCDKIVISDQGELLAFVIYNYSKKYLLNLDDTICELNICDKMAVSIKNWCEYFRIYDEAEKYFASI